MTPQLDGAREASYNMILACLRARFKDVPKELCERVRTISDLTLLESLVVNAVNAPTLAEVARNVEIVIELDRKPE